MWIPADIVPGWHDWSTDAVRLGQPLPIVLRSTHETGYWDRTQGGWPLPRLRRSSDPARRSRRLPRQEDFQRAFAGEYRWSYTDHRPTGVFRRGRFVSRDPSHRLQ